jgi:tight adherence protein B
MTTGLFAALLVGSGLAMLVMGILGRTYAREEQLAEILDLPYGDRDVDVEAAVERHSPLVENTIGLASKVVEQVDAKGAVMTMLERARIPIRPGELVILTLAGSIVLGVFIAAITSQWVLGIAALLLGPLAVKALIDHRISSRRKAFEAAFPDALSLIASSLSAGHTFLRSIQMMCEEAEAPLAEEFQRVVSETQLGDPLVDALERMARRLDIRDVVWVVQAIRIQQTVGGKLADLLHTLADFIRAREEIRREIQVLTAEGRISAWVLGALPVFLLLAIQVMNPGYLDPMFEGWGLVVLAATAGSIMTGVGIILRMVRIEV